MFKKKLVYIKHLTRIVESGYKFINIPFFIDS